MKNSTVASYKNEMVVARNPVIDKQSFFTIQFDSKEYTSYGYYDDASSKPYGGPTLTQTIGVDIFGKTVSNIVLEAGDLYKGEINPISLGNCNLKLSLEKRDVDLLGIYSGLTGDLSEQSINQNTIEELYFDNNWMRLTIDRIVQHPSNKAEMVEGHISCLLYKCFGGFRILPCAGNFRMYLKKKMPNQIKFPLKNWLQSIILL